MYQSLSIKNDREYFINEENYFVNNYDIDVFMKEREGWNNKPLFQTMLDYLNTDYNKMALSTFIDFICMFSVNHTMRDAKQHIFVTKQGNSYIGKYTEEYISYNDRDLQNEQLCNFLYELFPDDKKKLPISKIKGHRKKGMTINRQIDKLGIEFFKKSYQYRDEVKIQRITHLHKYIDEMDETKLLLNPSIFLLYIQRVIEAMIQYTTNTYDISVGQTIPLIPSTEPNSRYDFTIDKFVSAVGSVQVDNEYDEYLLIAKGDVYGDGGHADNQFSFDTDGINEFNIVISNIYFILQQGWNIKKCPNCGKYFVNRKRKDVKYCSNPAPLDTTKTCEQYAKTRGYYLKNKNDELEHLRTQIKDRLRQRAARNGGEDIERNNQFKKYDKQFRKYSRDNDKESLYLDWLKKVDKEIKKGGGKIPKPSM